LHFSIVFFLGVFFCTCSLCLSRTCIFQSFVCIISPFFQDVNILEQAQFDSTRPQVLLRLSSNDRILHAAAGCSLTKTACMREHMEHIM
jgi:hypothetical protein